MSSKDTPGLLHVPRPEPLYTAPACAVTAPTSVVSQIGTLFSSIIKEPQLGVAEDDIPEFECYLLRYFVVDFIHVQSVHPTCI